MEFFISSSELYKSIKQIQLLILSHIDIIGFIKFESTICVSCAQIIGYSFFGVVEFNIAAKRDSSRTHPVGYEEAKEHVSIYGDMYPEVVATTVTEQPKTSGLRP